MKSGNSPFRKLKVLYSLYLYFALTLVANSLLYFQYVQNYKSATVSRLNLSVAVLDGQFQKATDAVTQLLMSLNGDCNHDQFLLSQKLVEEPSVQSFNLIEKQKITCSTHQPNVGMMAALPAATRFAFIKSNIVVPGKTIAVIKASNQRFEVSATLHGFVLYGIVQLLDIDTPLHINSDFGWINSQSQFIDGENIDATRIHSKKFPYSVSTQYDTKTIVINFVHTNIWAILLLQILCIAVSIFYFLSGTKREVIQSIKKGILKREFEPYVQGVTDINGQLSGCELLMRWNHNGSLIQPDEFIPVTEKYGLIVPLSTTLINDTYDFFLTHYYNVPEGFQVAFNISPIQLTEANSKCLLESIRRFRRCSKLSKVKVILELTERQIVLYTPETIETIHKLHELGVDIVIDDFGTGYSSLENVLELKIDGLKIDKRFVDKYPADELSANLIDNMVDLAQRLKVPVVAEGIETQEQVDAFRQKGVRYFQGYFFYKPVALKSFLSTLKTQ